MKKKIFAVCVMLFLVGAMGLTGCGAILEDLNLTMESEGNTNAKQDFSATNETEEPQIVTEFVLKHNKNTFAYDRLSDIEKIWYENINSVLAERSDVGIDLSAEGFEGGLTEESIDKIYNCVMVDHPEYFYVEGYEYTKYMQEEDVVGISFLGKYILSAKECEKRKSEIEDKAVEILSYAPVNGDDYDKIKYVYEYIIKETEYCLDAPDSQNIYSVLINGQSVCQGYAKTSQYLLNQLGVEATIVYGGVGAEAHSWNLVKCNGEYYYVDVTWGDASYITNGKKMLNADAPYINYDYLCIPKVQIERTHVFDDIIPLPECVSMKDNYYVREGCYFETCDMEQLEREMKEAFSSKQKMIMLKCASPKVYFDLYTELLTNQKIFQYLPNEQSNITYTEDKEYLTMTFWMTK